MNVSSAKCPNRAMEGITIGFLIDTYALPAILLVIKFHSGAIGSLNELIRCIPREAPEITTCVLFKESNIPHFEFLGLFGVVPYPFCSILPNTKEVVESNHREVAHGPVKFGGIFAHAQLYEVFGNIHLDRSCFVIGGSSFQNPSIICWRHGRSLSDPAIFVGFEFVAKAIAWPMAVIALDTLEAWTCFP
jgi:hypothetical protein